MKTECILRLYVYGTLKRVFWNHDSFYRGLLTAVVAVGETHQLLYRLAEGD